MVSIFCPVTRESVSDLTLFPRVSLPQSSASDSVRIETLVQIDGGTDDNKKIQ